MEELALRPSLSVPEAARFSGLGIGAVNAHLDAGDFLWFPEGARRRVLPGSILEYCRRRAEETKAGA